MRVALGSLVLIASCGRIGFDPASLDLDAPRPDGMFRCANVREVPASGVLAGTLVADASTTEGSCGGFSTSEDVYAIDVDVPGAALQVFADDQLHLNTTLHVRTSCDDASSELACSQTDGVGDQPLITQTVATGRYFIFVDGSDAGGGEYAGNVRLLIPDGADCTATDPLHVCGPSLGCVAGTCQPESCASAFVLGGASPIVTMTDTRTQPNLHGAHIGTMCGAGGDNGTRAPESIFRLDLATSVTQLVVSTISTNTDYDTLIYVRGSCTGPDLACNDDGDPSNASQVTIGPLAAGSYFIFVDGFGFRSGRAELTVTITP